MYRYMIIWKILETLVDDKIIEFVCSDGKTYHYNTKRKKRYTAQKDSQ